MSANLLGIYEIIEKKLHKHSFTAGKPKTINYGIQFEIFKDEWQSVIRIFEKKNGKINIDFSPLKGEKAAAVRSIIEDKKDIAEDSIAIKYPYIGTDESGKGDTFGPVTAAGVLLDEAQQKILFKAGVKDSKENDDETNLRLAEIIKDVCKGSYEITVIMPEEYNKLYEEHKNMNTILAGLHTGIIKKLAAKDNCHMAIVDQFADDRLIGKNFATDNIKLYHTTGGEKYTAVAAASILARGAYLDGLKSLSGKYGIQLPKGSSEHVFRVIEELKKRNLLDKINMIAKTHFANLKAVL